MTGIPSKDRAEAHMAAARDLVREITKHRWFSIVEAGHARGLIQEQLESAQRDGFAEGMKRAAEIAQEKAAEYDGYVKRAAVRDLPNGVDAEKSDVARAIRCVILSELERR